LPSAIPTYYYLFFLAFIFLTKRPSISLEIIAYASSLFSQSLTGILFLGKATKFEIGVLFKLTSLIKIGTTVLPNFTDCSNSYAKLPDTLTGMNGGNTAGVGVTAIFDNRDHPIAAHTGWYSELSFMSNGKLLGSDYSFTSFDADLRKFFQLSAGSILAFQAVGSIKSGQVPFLQLSCLGGDEMMRGIYAGRYRDKDGVAAQAEFRQMIAPRWGFVLFAGEGKVGSDLKNLNGNQLQDTYGVGLRRVMSRNDRVSLRMDVGVGNGQASLYVSIGEAF
jgi:outer membrane protein assembly factor BamA